MSFAPRSRRTSSRDHKGHFERFADFQDPEAFGRLTQSIAKLPWYIYAKPSFSKAQYVLEYLGRYTHRIGISNSRLVAVSDSAVTFRTKGEQTTTMHPLTLLRRFIQHVLPHNFHKIRHVGLYASPKLLFKARAALGSKVARKPTSWMERLVRLTGRDVSRCPRCGAPLVKRPLGLARAPPARAA